MYRDPNAAGVVPGRHIEDVFIPLTSRDLEEMMAERGLSIDHVTIWRWVQRYAPVLNQRIRRELRRPNRSWRVDETYVRVAGDWAYLYRAVDSAGETIEFLLSPKRDLIAAKLFLRLALSGEGPSPRVINVDGHLAYASAIAELKQSGELGRRCACRTSPYLIAPSSFPGRNARKLHSPPHPCNCNRTVARLGFTGKTAPRTRAGSA